MRTLDIERLLQWAYRDELPKLEWLGVGGSNLLAAESAWERVMRAKECPERPSDGRPSFGNRYAVLFAGGPHPDALELHAALKRLDAPELVPALDDDPAALLSDMPREIQAEAEAGLQRYHVELRALVMRHARMGTRPDWRVAAPEKKPVIGSFGKPLWFVSREVTGAFGQPHRFEEIALVDPKTSRPPAGAYRKYEWEPPVWSLVDDRMDYLAWRGALAWLVEDTAGLLTEHAARGPAAAAWPWEDGERPEPRVLKAVA